jgi:thymidylate synthase (FAD)
MRIVEQNHVILFPTPLYIDGREVTNGFTEMGRLMEIAGRVSYHSEDKITNDSWKKFVAARVKEHHMMIPEFGWMVVQFTTDIGVGRELLRHRMTHPLQESTRYCNYMLDKFGGDIGFIPPLGWKESEDRYKVWVDACKAAEMSYGVLLAQGATPQEARDELPLSTATHIVMAADMHEWIHIFEQRVLGTTGKPHPKMVALMKPLYEECKKLMPEVFTLD